MRKSKLTEELIAGEIVTIEADDTTCAVCYAEFLEPEDLQVHLQQVHPAGIVINCQFCVETFPNAEMYVLHIRDVHLVELRSCRYCSRVFTDLSILKKHQGKHIRPRAKNSFFCSQCRRFFPSTFELSQHEYAEHPAIDSGVFLNDNFALLSSVINIKADDVVQVIGKDFIYVCSQCKYSDADLEGYVLHLKEKDCRSLVCDKCYKVYSKKSAIIDHFIKNPYCHNTVNAPPQKQCKECLKDFDQRAFKQHIQTCKVIKCSSCKITFENMYQLSEHTSKDHPLAVALVLCKFCRKECVGKVALAKHVERTHNHDLHLYKYACSYCDTPFKHPQRLFAHYFMKHKELEPYLCKICDKKFRLRKQFTLHIKLTHSSNGFVEFDEKLHVFFTDKKSEKPFQPESKYAAKKTVANEKQKNKDTTVSTGNDEDDDLQLVNVNSDFMNPTETEGNQTDANTTTRKRKRKTKSTYKRSEIDETLRLSEDCDSEDEPLLVIKKKAKIKSQLRKRALQWTKKNNKNMKSLKQRFTCKICKQYCYTFQNYHNHISMHFKDESKKCIKCSLSFKSKTDLQNHLVEQHSSSKLTETLKNLIERRKKGEHNEELSMSAKFLNTIKKVKCDKDNVTATLKPVSKELSVQKFIENFTPEATEVKTAQIKSSISFTKIMGPIKREPLIKMTKFKPAPKVNEASPKLAMPIRFKQNNEKHSVSIKIVKSHAFESKMNFDNDNGNQFQDDHDTDDGYQDQNREAYIPEAEQEVTLEGTDETPSRNPFTHKIVIPKLPKELKSIRIAHLLPEAPYYKIVKMDDIMKTKKVKEVKEPVKFVKKPMVQLPDGTKLVHVNPLAHLLGNTPVEKLVPPTSKYYKPKAKNFEDVLAKALLKLEAPKKQTKKKVEKSQLRTKELVFPGVEDKIVEREQIVEVENTEQNNEAIVDYVSEVSELEKNVLRTKELVFPGVEDKIVEREQIVEAENTEQNNEAVVDYVSELEKNVCIEMDT